MLSEGSTFLIFSPYYVKIKFALKFGYKFFQISFGVILVPRSIYSLN